MVIHLVIISQLCFHMYLQNGLYLTDVSCTYNITPLVSSITGQNVEVIPKVPISNNFYCLPLACIIRPLRLVHINISRHEPN